MAEREKGSRAVDMMCYCGGWRETRLFAENNSDNIIVKLTTVTMCSEKNHSPLPESNR